MLLAEVLSRKSNIDDRIEELHDYLVNLPSDDGGQDFSEIDSVVTKIYELLDERQQQLFTLDKINRSVEIKIGNSKTSLASAVRLRDTIERKIDVLSSLIDACKDSKFSIMRFLENKDKLLAEHNILVSTIKQKDWTVELDE